MTTTPTHLRKLILMLTLVLGACGSSASVTSTGGASVSVEGTWQMIEFNGEVVDAETNTATIPEIELGEGMLTGNFGCNDGGGSYEQVDGAVLFSDIAAEGRGCPRPDGQAGLVPTETQLLLLFNSGQPVALEIDGSNMSWSQEDSLLSFERVGE